MGANEPCLFLSGVRIKWAEIQVKVVFCCVRKSVEMLRHRDGFVRLLCIALIKTEKFHTLCHNNTSFKLSLLPSKVKPSFILHDCLYFNNTQHTLRGI